MSAGGVSPSTLEQYQKTKENAEKLSQTKVGTHSKDVMDKVAESILKAREALEAGNDKGRQGSVGEGEYTDEIGLGGHG